MVNHPSPASKMVPLVPRHVVVVPFNPTIELLRDLMLIGRRLEIRHTRVEQARVRMAPVHGMSQVAEEHTSGTGVDQRNCS